MQFFEFWPDFYIVKHNFQNSKRSHQSPRLEIFEKFVFLEIWIDFSAFGALPSYFHHNLISIVEIMLNPMKIRISMTFVASLCLLVLFVLWVWCVSALILVFVTCFSGRNISIVLMKLWWFCKRVLRGKLWEVRRRGSLRDQIRSRLAFHFFNDFFVTYCSWR